MQEITVSASTDQVKPVTDFVNATLEALQCPERIRDDCVPFDPKSRNELTDPKDFLKNIGIRMVYKAATDIEYQSILGLNVLTIRI